MNAELRNSGLGPLHIQLLQTDEALKRGYGLPSRWYTDPEILRLERQEIFSKEWMYFCHVGSLPENEPGYVARDLAGFPILVTRDREGVLHAFRNMCRHRLHPLAEGCGSAARLTCPYHAWTWKMSGEILAIPHMDEIQKAKGEKFPSERLRLIPVALQAWGPLLFINLDIEAAPLAKSLGPLAEFDAKLVPELATVGDPVHLSATNYTTRPRWLAERIIRCNWKTMADNSNECYHCPTVHRGLASEYDIANFEFVNLGSSFPGYASRIPKKPEEGKGRDRDLDHHVQFFFPNFYIGFGGPGYGGTEAGGYLLDYYSPIDEHHLLFRHEVMLPVTVPQDIVEEHAKGSLMVADEDQGVAESVQRAHEAGNGPIGYLMPQSDGYVSWFHRKIFDRVASAVGSFEARELERALNAR